jgi:DNA-binding CsgD family transcriptional regulator
MRVQGESSSAIATSMQRSPKTVLNNLTSIRQKLAAENDVQLVYLAARHGLVGLSGGHGVIVATGTHH